MVPRRLVSIAGAIVLASAVAPARAATVQIAIENLEFSPAEASAKVGDTVEWINKDVVDHSATARNGDFDVNIPSQKTVKLVLKKAGTVAYYCRYHPNMTATLKIEQ